MSVDENTWKDDYAKVMMRSAPIPQALLVRGEGCYVYDEDGKPYLDFLAGIAVNSLGHAHPAFVEAITTQASTLGHISNLYASKPQLELAARLIRLAGAGDKGRVFFGNSGAEAIEAAIKLARRNKQHGTIIALENSFHGRTVGAVSLTGKPALRTDFEPLLPNVLHIPSTIEALEEAMNDDIAALVVEPIKGEAGVIDLPEGYLAAARELTTKHGALLIIDEIQTGAGRTGTWFAFQQHGIVPDAIAVAKGIGGGVPIGALITFGSASELFTKGQHGSTFGGNPLTTAVANAVLGYIEDAGLVERAAIHGQNLRDALLSIDTELITEVRGRGLLLGIGLSSPIASELAAKCFELGLIVNPANDSSIRIAPPLIVGPEELAEFILILSSALEAIK